MGVEKMQTRTVKFLGGGYITVKYGMHYLKGNSQPYFSITADLREDGNESGGQLHPEISRYVPELEPLLKWHLCDQNGTPMHYVENSLFWWERFDRPKEKSYDPDAKSAFKNSTVWGAVETDVDLPTGLSDWPLSAFKKDGLAWPFRVEVEALLVERLPALQAEFRKVMAEFGVEDITEEEQVAA
jgi:hypothetical protein